MPTPLVAVPIVATVYERPDGSLAATGQVTAKAIGRSRVVNAAVILGGSVTWDVVNGALVARPGGALQVMAPASGTLYYAVTETIEGNVTGPYVVAVDATMAPANGGTGLALAGYQTGTDPAQVPANVYPGTKGDKGDPGTSPNPSEYTATANPQASAVTPSTLLGKITRFRSGVTQAFPPAVADAVVVVGFSPVNLDDPSPTFTRNGSDVFGSSGATSISDLLPGEVRQYHCTTPGTWHVGYDHKGRTALDKRYAGRPTVYSDFTGQTDGALPTFDSGQATESGGNLGSVQGGRTIVAPVVRSGAATCDRPSSGGWAAYLDAVCQRDLTRIGCEFTFDTHTTGGGGAALVLWNQSYVGGPTTITTPCHLVLLDGSWQYSVKATTGGSLTLVGSGTYDALTAGVAYRCDVFLYNSTAIILLPDGTITTITDPLIGTAMAGGSKVACWEPYAAAQTDGKAAFAKVWADTVASPAAPGAGGVSLAQLRDFSNRQAINRTRNLPKQSSYGPTAQASYPIAQSTSPVDPTNVGMDVVAPATGHLDVEFEFYLSMSIADTVLVGASFQAYDASGNLTGGVGSVYNVVASGAQVNGRQSVSVPLTLAPGTTYRIGLLLYRVYAGTGTVNVLAGGNGPASAGLLRTRVVPTV